MDPKACLQRFLDGDEDAVQDYNEWIKNGGFGARVFAAPYGECEVRKLGAQAGRKSMVIAGPQRGPIWINWNAQADYIL